MNKIKNLLHIFFGRRAVAAVLPMLVLVAAVPALAQTADVRYAGVFYKDNPDTINGMYCDNEYGTSGKSSTQTNAALVQVSSLPPRVGSG